MVVLVLVVVVVGGGGEGRGVAVVVPVGIRLGLELGGDVPSPFIVRVEDGGGEGVVAEDIWLREGLLWE